MAILRHEPWLDGGASPSPAQPSEVAGIAEDEHHNLPAEPNAFIGRGEDIAAITALIESGARLVTITGLGGSGKSRLAVQLGRRLDGRFRDGVRWVDLAPTVSADQLPEAIAFASGVREQPGRTIFESLLGALRGRHQLLIVDNCEPLLWHVAHALEAILGACPDVVVLATSREPLRLAIEQVWPLLGLDGPDRRLEVDLARAPEVRGNEAIALFLERGRAANPRRHVPDEELPAVGAIVRRVDGLPLAIEMAAAWLRAMGPHEIAARLAGGSSLLALASGTPRPRHRTLEATFDSSFDLLEPGEQRLLRRLSVFAGSVDAGAIGAVGGWDVADPMDSVATLVDRSLVVAVASSGATHYRLLETIREYGRLKLRAAAEEHEAADRHLQWCLAVAEQAYWRRVRDEPGAIQALTGQLDEFRLALDRSAGRGDGTMPRLAGLLAWFWAATGRVTEGRQRVTAALDEADLDIDRGRLLVGLGATATFLGDPTSAVATLEEAVQVWHAFGDAFEECLALSALGWAHFWPGENEQALASFRSGAAIAEAIGANDLRLRLLAGECQVLVAAGDPARALPLARYLADTAPPGDVRTAHLAHHFLADCSLLVADCRAAAREYAVALGLARELDDQLEIMIELQGFAMAQAGLGRPREAVLLAGAADEGLDRLGLVTTVPFWLALLERWIGGAMASLSAPDLVRSEGKALGLVGALELARSLPL
jgi:non-specific serine/threonine protein kinase